jgi:hypothetical protein
MTRETAVKILRQHSIEVDQPTAWFPETGTGDPASTFDLEVGIKDEYTSSEVYNWLGY